MVRFNSKKMNITYRAILTLTPETHKGAGFYKTMKLVIADPIYMEAFVDRTIGSNVNTGVIKFHNLNENTSSLINQTNYELLKDALDEEGKVSASEIVLYAFYLGIDANKYNTIGYTEPVKIVQDNKTDELLVQETGLEVGDLEEHIVFKGVITEANTYRESGSTEKITEICADDRFIELGLVDSMIVSGEDKKATIIRLAEEGGYKEINIGDFEGPLLNNWVVDKDAFTTINRITGGLAFIDNGVLNVLNNNEVLTDKVRIIKLDSESGLLGTPRRTWGQLTGSIIFSPELKLAMKVRIESKMDARWDGEYKVLGLSHRLSIGPGSMNYATTEITVITSALAQASSIILTGTNAQTPQLAKYVNRTQVMASPVSSKSVYDVIEYIKVNKRAPQWYITSEITWANAIGSDNFKVSRQLPTDGELKNVVNVCRIVQGIKDRHYPNGVLSVNSGWRSRGYNATLGGSVSNSQHLYGRALDFTISGYDMRDVFKFLTGVSWRNGGTFNDGKNTRVVPGWTYYMEGNGGLHYDTMTRVGRTPRATSGWSDG